MAGIYFHIPFCKQACYYCDFHFSTNTDVRARLVTCMAKELGLQGAYLNEPVATVYFGGGTPSILPTEDLGMLLETARQTFHILPGAEITIEANPDDLTAEKLKDLRELGINRLSIGIQSFDDNVLRFLNRVHNSELAIASVERARHAGFSNINVDLIYAIPGQSPERWLKNIHTAVGLHPEHISAYSLTIEDQTVFGRWAAKGKLVPVTDDAAANDMEVLVSILEDHGLEQYEVSNFARPGWHSKHNSSYWQGTPYLGIGPSAHSYNKVSRQFNVPNNHEYVRKMEEGIIPATIEHLSINEHINDYLLTTLRTVWGSDLEKLRNDYGVDIARDRKNYIRHLEENGMATLSGGRLSLTRKGRFFADKISSDLFVDDRS